MAINSDAKLSKLIEAQDGPGNTLVVLSLIDGERSTDDLSIRIVAPTTLTNGDVAQLNTWYGTAGANAAQHLATFAAQIEAFDLKGDYSDGLARSDRGGREIDGSNSDFQSDNVITPGTGNDVVVLGTGFYSNDTVVYEGFGNGNDTIVNFDTTWWSREETVEVTPASQNSRETFVATFGNVTPGASGAATVTFDGVEVNLTEGAGPAGTLIPAQDVVQQFIAAYNASGSRTWTATSVADNPNQVQFTKGQDSSPVYGDQTNVVNGDFAFTNATSAVTVSDIVDGTSAYAAATSAYFTVDLMGTVGASGPTSVAIADGTFVFSYDLGDGPVTFNIDYLAGDGGLTLTEKFVAAINANSPDFTARVANVGETPFKAGAIIVEANEPGYIDLDAVFGPLATEIANAISNGVDIKISDASVDPSTGLVESFGADQAGTPADRGDGPHRSERRYRLPRLQQLQGCRCRREWRADRR
ncbi:MAG: hypothetical protein MZV65_46485 [Chromatiales bacterium]|nr:hypothetical protein [Chromatiales bacterium]